MKRVWISFIAAIVSAAVSSGDLAGWDAATSHDRTPGHGRLHDLP